MSSLERLPPKVFNMVMSHLDLDEPENVDLLAF